MSIYECYIHMYGCCVVELHVHVHVCTWEAGIVLYSPHVIHIIVHIVLLSLTEFFLECQDEI